MDLLLWSSPKSGPGGKGVICHMYMAPKAFYRTRAQDRPIFGLFVRDEGGKFGVKCVRTQWPQPSLPPLYKLSCFSTPYLGAYVLNERPPYVNVYFIRVL